MMIFICHDSLIDATFLYMGFMSQLVKRAAILPFGKQLYLDITMCKL